MRIVDYVVDNYVNYTFLKKCCPDGLVAIRVRLECPGRGFDPGLQPCCGEKIDILTHIVGLGFESTQEPHLWWLVSNVPNCSD